MKTLYLKNGEQKEIDDELANEILKDFIDYEHEENRLIIVHESKGGFVLAIRSDEIKAII